MSRKNYKIKDMKSKILLLTTIAIIGLRASTFAQVPNYVPSNGLVGWWPFNGNANDESGNGNNGTNSGATLTTDRLGNINNAYAFTSGNYIVSSPNLPIGNSARSVSLWFQTTSTSYNTSTGLGANVMMSYGTGPGTSGTGVAGQLICETQVGNLVLNHYVTGLGGSGVFVSDGSWHNVIYTFNGSVHNLYLDGLLIDTDNYLLNTGTTNLYFGKRATELNMHQYNGKIDDVAIWNRALTQEEITALYLGCNPVNATVTSTGNTTFCQGDTVMMNANTGTNYTYQWMLNGNNISAATNSSYTATQGGNYTVKIDSLGCSGISSATLVTVNPLPTVGSTANPSATVCTGASVTLNGTGASTYTWTGGITNGTAFTPTSTLTYTVTGTDINTCTNTATKTITVNQLPTVTASATASTLCIGGSTTLTGGGASTYIWSGGVTNGTAFNPTSTLTYTVTGTDINTCTNTATKTITVNQLPTITASATASTFCIGGSTTLTGGGASTYIWSGGVTNGTAFSPTSTLTYTVTGTDANTCTNTATQTITVNPLPTVSINTIPSFININASAMALTGNPAGGTFTGSGVSSNNFSPIIAGLGTKHISYNYTDNNTCSNSSVISTIVYDTTGAICTSYDTTLISVTDTLVINAVLTGINPPNNVNTIKVFPNPANDHITINYGDFTSMSGYTLEITNNLGQVVFTTLINQQTSYVALSTWTGSGLYFVSTINGQGNTVDIKKIVIQ